MFKALPKERPRFLGRKRARRERPLRVAVNPAKELAERHPHEWRKAWRVAIAVFGFLFGASLVRHRGPGLPHEERWEFENEEIKEALRAFRQF